MPGREAPSDISKTAIERGEIVYGYVCERCHAFDTPSSYGPTMSGIVREYLSSHADRATTVRSAAIRLVSMICQQRRISRMRFGATYSVRSVRAGSTLTARCAGNQHAAADTMASNSATDTYVGISVVPIP